MTVLCNQTGSLTTAHQLIHKQNATGNLVPEQWLSNVLRMGTLAGVMVTQVKRTVWFTQGLPTNAA